MGFVKNSSVTGFTFVMVKASDGSAVTSGTVSGYITKDGGGQSSLTSSPVHNGNGQWKVDLTAAEMNADYIGLLFTHAEAVPVHFTIKAESPSVEKAVKMLVNKAVQDKVSGEVVYYDDDGQTPVLTHTPVDSDDEIVRTPS